MWLRPNVRTELRRKSYQGFMDLDQIRKIEREECLNKRREDRMDEDKLESPPTLVAWVMSDDNRLQLEATTQISMLLSLSILRGYGPIIEEVIKSGVVPRFVEFLKREDFPQLQVEAARALKVIASGTSENTKLVIDLGAVPIFVKLLGSPSDDVREQAVWALQFVACDSPGSRDLVLDNGALGPLLNLLNQLDEHSRSSMLRTATHTLSSFCRGKPPPPFEQIKHALPTLGRLIHSIDMDVLQEACHALSYLSDGTNDQIQAVIDANVCPRLVDLLRHSSTVFPALRTVGNIVTGDDLQIQTIINHQALPCLLNLLTSIKEKIKKEACWIISNITAGNNNQIQAVIDAGIISALVHLLQTAEFDIKKEAARAISNATSGGTNVQIKYLVSEGCIKPLCDLLVCPDQRIDQRIVTVCLKGLENILKVGEAEKTLGNTEGVNSYAQFIADVGGLKKIENLQHHYNREICEEVIKILEMLCSPPPMVASPPPMVASSPPMVAKIMSDDNRLQLEATIHFRNLLSIEPSPPIEEVIKSGVVPRFVEFLKREDFPQLQLMAAWALTNIAAGTSENTKVVIDHGSVSIFVKLLDSPSDDVREQAAWALGNVAVDSPRSRDLVLGNGALWPLLAQLNEHSRFSMLRTATHTLSTFCCGKPPPPFEQTKPALPTLKRLIHSIDMEVLTDACWALSYLSVGTNDRIQALIDANVCPRLVDLLRHPSPSSVLIPVLRTVGNIVTGDDLQTQTIINHQALPCLLNLLTSIKENFKKEACWIISNITAGNNNQIQAVIDAGIISPLVHLLQTAEFDIKKEVAWAISNATGGTNDQIKYLVNEGCIKPLCDLLDCPDQKIVTACLKGLENILKVGEAEKTLGNTEGVNSYAEFIADVGVLEKIEDLQNYRYNNKEIYEKAIKILETYWVEEELEDDGFDETMPG